MLEVLGAGRTEKGPVRKRNDDAFRVFAGPEFQAIGRGALFAVADGIGSYRAGGQAAQMAVDQLALYFRYPEAQFSGPQTLVDLIWKANDAITRLRTGQKEYYGMGCTLTALLTDPQGERAIVYQVGDSMAYLLRDSVLTPISSAHQDSESGELTNHMGIGLQLQVERVRFTLKAEDRILLCTDGISGYLSHDEILELMVTGQDAAACVDALVERGLTSSKDNVTVVVAQVVS
jgi:serine/threonine protein phosphatase PrpC